MKRTLLVVTAAAALTLSGCGGGAGGGAGGGLSSDEQKVADNLSKRLLDQGQGETLSVTKEEANCISEDMVGEVGVDQLQEYGIVKEDLTVNKDPDEVKMSTADAEATADAIFGCADVQAMVDEEMGKQLAGQPPAVKKCFEEALNDERLRSMLVSTFSGQEERAQQELVKPVMECAQKAMGG